MLFWFFMLAMALLVPLTMVLIGRWYLSKPPKTINGFFGYRTARSMKNQAAWDFAQRALGKIWMRCGVVMLPVSLLAMLLLVGRSMETIACWALVICLVQTIVLLLTIIPVEWALKHEFDI